MTLMLIDNALFSAVMTRLATERTNGMNDGTLYLDETEQEIFTEDVSDEALELAARMEPVPAGLPCTAAPFLAPTFGAGKC